MNAKTARTAELQQLKTNGYEKMKEIIEIEQNEREAREKERIEERNYQTAMKKAEEGRLPYLPVEDPSKGQLISQTDDLELTAVKQAEQDRNDFEKNVLTFNGGKKRKTHKKRK